MPPKRKKCDESHRSREGYGDDSNNERSIKRPKQQALGSSPYWTRKSARLQKVVHQQASAEEVVSAELQSHLPTPAATHPSPARDSSGQKKRKRSSRDSNSNDRSAKNIKVPAQVEEAAVDDAAADNHGDADKVLSQRHCFSGGGDDIKHWIVEHEWPPNFAAERLTTTMDSSENSRKRSKPSVTSYSQSVKDGTVPEQYSVTYESWIQKSNLYMDTFDGEQLVAQASKTACSDLQKVSRLAIDSTISLKANPIEVVRSCQGRNEAKINRDITPMLVPSNVAIDAQTDTDLKHIVDEVNADWYATYVLAGPRIRPDLALGITEAAFSKLEVDKLSSYASVDNWTKFTQYMYFPFLLCEVKCGNAGLDHADRQNMHSSSVALRAILRLEQEADKFRPEGQLKQLDRQVLIFSMSHNDQDLRLYGHFAELGADGRWLYRRYEMNRYSLRKHDHIVAVYNCIQNIFEDHVSKHIKRIKDALAALPEPPTESVPISSTDPSVESASNRQGADTSRTDDSFKKPELPIARILERMEKQMEQSAQREEGLKKQLELERLEREQERLERELERRERDQQMTEMIRLLRNSSN